MMSIFKKKDKNMKRWNYNNKLKNKKLSFLQKYRLEKIKKKWTEINWEWNDDIHEIVLINRRTESYYDCIWLDKTSCQYFAQGCYYEEPNKKTFYMISQYEHKLLTKIFKILKWDKRK